MAVLENLRIRVDADLNRAFGECCDRKRISKQDAIESLVRFLLSQDDLAQSLILGQVKPTPEIMALIYQNISGSTPMASDRMTLSGGVLKIKNKPRK